MWIKKTKEWIDVWEINLKRKSNEEWKHSSYHKIKNLIEYYDKKDMGDKAK